MCHHMSQNYRPRVATRKIRCRKCFIGTCAYIAVLLLLVFIILFVVVPMAFKYSVEIQRGLIFPTYLIEDQNYSDVNKFGISGVRNMYIDVTTKDNRSISLGAWQILPLDMVSDLLTNEDYDFDGAFDNARYNILLYLHGNGSDRTKHVELYNILREIFHILAVDYRGYADSTRAEITEQAIVSDLVHVYQWLRKQSNSRIFIWGHSLGTGVGTQLVSALKVDNQVPSGLVLEAPFTSVTDVMKMHPIVRFYSFLPWCKATILDPIVENGMDFNSKKYVEDVDCPIMILHAMDDDIIPVEMGLELSQIADSKRNGTYQGKVILHIYEALGYRHMNLWKAPELPQHVKHFVEECARFEASQ
ncbi:lysophosphatidylserine lipase ABHD12-like [Cylas formicarius]|uniref:lysophosphatidylserine lipase ABHD12-like n=1 Tax=Cylas formicarius TaxID=197179 RepID=UPI002958A18B|nr:lysophosphatidylserine lipase ABHD12-like [Cylas formicarius]